MIEVYKQVYGGKQICVAAYDTLEEFFERVYESDLKDFGYDKDQRVKGRYLFNDMPMYAPRMEVRFCYTVLIDGKFVTPDRLIGMRRDYVANRKQQRCRWWGMNKAYGHHRAARMQQERRLSYDKDEEYHVPFRAKRVNIIFPDRWDDGPYTHNDKSWKTQSKRKRQYK